MAGDVFQAVPSLRLELEPGVEPLNIYRALRRVNPSPYMYFLRMSEEMTVLGSSPEMLVRVTGRKLEYRPIAGTRKRGKDEAEDRRLEEELRHDEKERAEHVMLVDLGRNDVGRVSDYGTVKRPRPDVRGALLARDASGLRRGRHSSGRPYAYSRAFIVLSRRHSHRRAQSPGHGDH